MKEKQIKILLLTDLSSAYSRALLKGLVRYAQYQDNWTFYKMPISYRMSQDADEIIKWATKWHVDAIVAQLNHLDLAKLSNLNIPIIVQNYENRIPGVCNLTGDYYGTGIMAANYFIKRGYKSFAFYGIKETIWSRERYDGYRFQLSKHNFSVHTLFEKAPLADLWTLELDDLAKWIESLPSKTAIFTCDDYCGLRISDACKLHDIHIPEQVAILGVDNDELLCSIANPPLSSIFINAEEGGYLAGERLDLMIRNRDIESSNIILPPIEIIARESTAEYAIDDRHVKAAVDYICSHYQNKINVEDILKFIPMSRRLFEMRFKKNTGKSIYNFILEYRINRVSELLLTTDRKIEDLAISCGLSDSKNLSRNFSRIKGVTPSKFRERNRIN